MRRGFFRLWVVASVLWALPWIWLGASGGGFIEPARQANVFDQFDEAAPGVPTKSALEVKMAILEQARRGELASSPIIIPAHVNWSGTALLLGIIASVPALLLAIGWAIAGFSRPRERTYISRDSGLAP